MSRDRRLLERVSAHPDELYVCLYSWKPSCISLGKFQKPDPGLAELAGKLGLELVHRPTGGRAVLHHHDFSYSIVGSTRWGIPPGVRASYAYLNRIPARTLELLGFQPDRSRIHQKVSGKTSCFSFIQLSDLTVRGKKICASAQTWQGRAVLQHGSFPTRLDRILLARIFGEKEASDILANTAVLAGVSFERFADAFKTAVEEILLLNSKLRFNI